MKPGTKNSYNSLTDIKIEGMNYKIFSLSKAEVNGLDLVIVRYGEEVSVLYGRCLHRGALMADGHIDGENLICGVHGWDYRYDTGVSEYDNSEALQKFKAEVKEDKVEAYSAIVQKEIQKDRGLSIPGCPVGCDFDIGDDYSFGKFEKKYGL